MEKGKKRRVRERIKKIKRKIKEEVFFNVPNSLTLLRLILAFVVVYMIFSNFSRTIVTVVFAIAAITDWFDGYFARKLKQTTSIGARLDQVIDRLFTLIIVLAIAAFFLIYTHEKILLLFLIISREVIGLPGFIIRIIRNKDLYKVKYIGKITTFIQSVALALIILGVSWALYPSIIACLVGIIAGFDYLKDSIG